MIWNSFKSDNYSYTVTFDFADGNAEKIFKKYVKGEITDMTKNEALKDIDKIVVTKDTREDNKVICRAYSGNTVKYTYDAKCSPDDIFDFNIGAKLAVDRLYDGYDMTPKAKRKPYNGKIFIRTDVRKFSFLDPDYFSRENKIWEVRNGKIIDFGRATDIIYEDMTDEELTKLLCSANNCFIGYFYNIVDGYFVR